VFNGFGFNNILFQIIQMNIQPTLFVIVLILILTLMVVESTVK
jgi:hypothetical protein